MRLRGAAFQGGLAIIGLVAAYTTWQRDPVQSQGDVLVFDATKATLSKVRYVEANRWIELERAKDGDEPVLWVRQGSEAGATLDGGVASGEGDAGTVTEVATAPSAPRELRGGERGSKIYDRFAPLYGIRSLGKLPPDKVTELNLDDSSGRTLELTSQGATRTFKVSAIPGLSTPYLRDVRDGTVYLLASGLISELDPSSTNLVDRRLHAFEPSEVDAFTVRVGSEQREFIHQATQVPHKISRKSEPDKPDEFVRNWHDKVWSRLMMMEMLGKGEAPKSGEPKVAVRIDYSFRGKPKGWVELAQGPNKEMFARSENTAGWGTLHAGTEEVIAEAKKVVGEK